MLSDRDRDLIRAALDAAVDGPFFPDWEFRTLMGVERNVMRQVLDEWPTVTDAELGDLAVNNALLNLLSYPHDEWQAWRRFSDATQEELAATFRRWREDHGKSRPTRYFDDLS